MRYLYIQRRRRIQQEDLRLGPDDLKLFDKHAAKIKSFRWGVLAHPEASYLIDQDVLVALHTARPVSCFPQLRLLQWPIWGVQDNDNRYITMFLGQQLLEINLRISYLSSYKETLGCFKASCPALRSFSFTCEPSPEMREFFHGWTSLRSLKCSGSSNSAETWTLLTLLPNLEILNLVLSPSSVDRRLLARPGHGDETSFHVYSSLRRFKLSVVDRAASHLFPRLTMLSCPRLEALVISLSVDEQPDERFAQTLFSAISQMCSSRVLQTLKITWDPLLTVVAETTWFEASIVHFDVLSPLLSFVNIRTFSSNTFLFIDLDDAKMLEISQAWSSLVSFNLVPGPRVRHPRAQLTLKSLEYLSRNCPQLEEFGAVIDSQLIPERPSIATDDSGERCRLISLSLVDSVITNPESVALYLSSLFPSLVSVFQSCVMDEEYSKYQELWREVERLVRDFRKQG